jgi:AcrR family transcriptional regulator
MAPTQIASTARTRRQTQAETRARLIAVAHDHFLRDGLNGAVMERITAEAGYTRGAFHANFNSREELFVAVMRDSVERKFLEYRSILERAGSADDRYQALRAAIAERVTHPEWVLLQAEFQANALRDETIRTAYLEEERRRRSDGAALVRECASQLRLELSASPEELVALFGCLMEGLAVRGAIAREQDHEAARRSVLLAFDRLMARRVDGDQPNPHR